MMKDKILALFNNGAYSDIKDLVRQIDIKEKEKLLQILTEIESVMSDMSYYDGLIARYGDDNTREIMVKLKATKSAELRIEIEKRFCE